MPLLISGFWAFACLVYFLQPPVIEATSFAFARIVCEVLNKDFCIFKKCSLEKNSAGINVVNVHMQPLKPLENITIKVNLLRKIKNTYHQFYYECLIDLCEFLQNYNHQIPWGLMYRAMLPYTNANHSCPYSHDVIVKDLGLVGPEFNVIPSPKGEYLLKLVVLRNKIQKIKIQLFILKK